MRTEAFPLLTLEQLYKEWRVHDYLLNDPIACREYRGPMKEVEDYMEQLRDEIARREARLACPDLA